MSGHDASPDPALRRRLGAHYTAEETILDLIRPLFLDELRRRLREERALGELHEHLTRLRFLDPACGPGDFLLTAWRELRKLEEELLALLSDAPARRLSLDQFLGMDLDPEAVAAARKAGLVKIIEGNALRLGWPEPVDYIFGNPPFSGKQFRRREQRADLKRVFAGTAGAGVLDLACGWFRKAAEAMERCPETRAAFVVTNSVVQGEQPGVLWGGLFERGVRIQFARSAFAWRGAAAVHCVIIGFGRSEPERNINPYLEEAPSALLKKRSEPVSEAPQIRFGSMPNDGGHLLLSGREREELLRREPGAARFLRRLVGSAEFLNGRERYCLWLEGATEEEIADLPAVAGRVERVRRHRLRSGRAATRALAGRAALFGEIRQPSTGYLLLPGVSSARREYIPAGFLEPEVIATNLCLMVPGAGFYHFGVLSSRMHMSWVREVAGRLKSDYRYSNGIVYNNFPWPPEAEREQVAVVESAARAVLEARAAHPRATLAQLYDPAKMPAELRAMHARLDGAVDAAYDRRPFRDDAGRVAHLFTLLVAQGLGGIQSRGPDGGNDAGEQPHNHQHASGECDGH